MMKLCPACRGTFAGGRSCPGCGPQQDLLDMADPAAREYLRDDPMVVAVGAHYAERRGMVRSVVGFLTGFALGAFTLRMAFGAEGVARVVWIALAVTIAATVLGLAIRHALRLATAAARSPRYVVDREDEPVEKHRPAPRRGLRWLTW
ncbi:MAG: hypothetical protein IT379_19435 [Deltaproteobacteria bacterium]|nr:hypothetical protein [Deltaproteobacteria bacterium]